MPRPRRLVRALPLALGLFLIAPAAGAADKVVTLPGFKAPGTPAQYDKVKVLKQGPASAKRVLVLEPGTSAGAPSFRLVANDLLKRLPGWQVWSVERRENLLEDQSVADRAKAGTATPQQLFDYYLGWIGNDAVQPHFVPKTTEETGFARSWGMRVAMEDLRVVVRAARKGGRRVVLGGHSLGATMTTAYATWDFAGRAGAKDLAGLVLIDGGSGTGTRARPTPTAASAKAELAKLDEENPFLDLAGNGLTWSAGVFNVLGSTLALKDPTSPSRLQDFRFLPASLRSPYRVDNRAAYGTALDTQTGPENLRLVQQHIGSLSPSGDLRTWVNGELGTVERAAAAFSGIAGMDGTAWYHPRRLTLDGSAVNGGRRTAAQAVLGVRTTRGRDVRVPIYAFETALGKGRVLRAAKQLAALGRVPKRDVKLVDRSATFAHVDPLTARPEKNDFLKTVVPFLRRVR